MSDTRSPVDAALAELDNLFGHAVHHMSFQGHNWTVEHWLVEPGGHDAFDLDAPYQRDSVWTDAQRRNLIRSLTFGIPIGSILVAQTDDADKMYRVVDGKQRIETIRAFTEDRFAVPARWFPGGGDGEVRWSQLERQSQLRILRRQMSSIEFDSTRCTVHDPVTGEMARRVTADGKDQGAQWRRLDLAEQHLYERCVYLLVNAGGTAHTDDDLAVL